MYMYAMEVPSKKKVVNTTKEVELLNDFITLAVLNKYKVTDKDSFSIQDGTLIIQYRRLESDTQFNNRVKAAIAYNKRYDDFHANKSKS